MKLPNCIFGICTLYKTTAMTILFFFQILSILDLRFFALFRLTIAYNLLLSFHRVMSCLSKKKERKDCVCLFCRIVNTIHPRKIFIFLQIKIEKWIHSFRSILLYVTFFWSSKWILMSFLISTDVCYVLCLCLHCREITFFFLRKKNIQIDSLWFRFTRKT